MLIKNRRVITFYQVRKKQRKPIKTVKVKVSVFGIQGNLRVSGVKFCNFSFFIKFLLSLIYLECFEGCNYLYINNAITIIILCIKHPCFTSFCVEICMFFLHSSLSIHSMLLIPFSLIPVITSCNHDFRGLLFFLNLKPIPLKFIVILSSHLRLELPRGLFS